jgi:hypothetical protein
VKVNGEMFLRPIFMNINDVDQRNVTSKAKRTEKRCEWGDLLIIRSFSKVSYSKFLFEACISSTDLFNCLQANILRLFSYGIQYLQL